MRISSPLESFSSGDGGVKTVATPSRKNAGLCAGSEDTGVAAGDVRGRTRVVVAGVAGLLALTTVARIATFRDAGDLASRIVAAAESADRAAPPGATLVLVDVPGELDRDLSVPVFRYGLREALRARGIDRAIESWAVDRDRVAEPSRSASSEELRNARDDPARVVIQVHSDAGGGWRIDGGRP